MEDHRNSFYPKEPEYGRAGYVGIKYPDGIPWVALIFSITRPYILARQNNICSSPVRWGIA